MKAGVAKLPCGVLKLPARAIPLRASRLNLKVSRGMGRRGGAPPLAVGLAVAGAHALARSPVLGLQLGPVAGGLAPVAVGEGLGLLHEGHRQVEGPLVYRA